MTRVVALANPQAGAGKSAAAHGLAVMLADLGQAVLGVDLDAQAGFTRRLGIDPETVPASLYDVLLRGASLVDVMQDSDEGVDLVPAALELSACEAQLVTRPGREQLVRTALSPVLADYDWVVLDCPSDMGLLTHNALAMAQVLLMPTREPSPRAALHLERAAGEVRSFVNPGLGPVQVLMLDAAPTWADTDAAVLARIPGPPLDRNGYRELAKLLMASAR